MVLSQLNSRLEFINPGLTFTKSLVANGEIPRFPRWNPHFWLVLVTFSVSNRPCPPWAPGSGLDPLSPTPRAGWVSQEPPSPPLGSNTPMPGAGENHGVVVTMGRKEWFKTKEWSFRWLGFGGYPYFRFLFRTPPEILFATAMDWDLMNGDI